MPDRRSLSGAGILSLALLLVILSFLRIYFIGGDGTCDLLWNQNEAYLFIHGTRLGYTPSYLGYLGEMAREYFGIVPSPDERRPFTTVVRVSRLGLQRYEASEMFYRVTPLEETLYAAHYNDPELWKWVKTHFEKVSAEEQRKVGGTDRLSKVDFTAEKGWSALYSIESKTREQFSIHADGLPVAVQVKNGQVSISRSRLGQTPEEQRLTETIFYGRGQPQHVRKAEYERIFGN